MDTSKKFLMMRAEYFKMKKDESIFVLKVFPGKFRRDLDFKLLTVGLIIPTFPKLVF